MSILRFLTTTALAVGLGQAALADDASWPDLRAALYGDQALTPAGDTVVLDIPYRTQNDTRTQIAATVQAPEGKRIGNVTVVLDENPMPVSAVFDFDQPVERFAFDFTMRVNRSMPVHVVTTTTDGQIYVSETYLKTSGTGACAAPPGTDPIEALASLGRMELNVSTPDRVASLLGATALNDKTLDIAISHPSHSGMQMDQISLLFIPIRYVETVQVDVDDLPYVKISGSISLSENPDLSLSIPGYTQRVSVTLTDTDETQSTAQASVAGL